MQSIQFVNKYDCIIFDLNSIKFAYPIIFLSLAVIINWLKINGIKSSIVNNSCSYLNTIFFPDGLNPEVDADWPETLSHYQSRSYLPICSIPTSYSKQGLRDDLISSFEHHIQQKLKLIPEMNNAILYLISEAFDNIVEHAKVKNGWLMFQNYQKLKFLDICIADSGIGLLGSYQENNFIEINSNKLAMIEAIHGRSTKNIEGGRGYGIKTSRKMLVRGLKGIYFLMSGNVFYYYSSENEFIHELETSMSWKGTLLLLRIYHSIPHDFRYLNYLD